MTVAPGSAAERSSEIRRLGVAHVICGALSDLFHDRLREAGIELSCGVTGKVQEVIEAWRNGTLNQARFRMPGAE